MNSDWRELRLSEALKIIGGGTPKTTVSEYWDGDIPWLSVVDFNNSNRWVYSAEKSITDKGLQESSTKILKKGQLIISARGTVGILAQLAHDMAFNQSCYGLDADPKITSNDFLYYAINSIVEDVRRSTHGAVFDTIIRNSFDHLYLRFPPLSYQNAIVELLTAIDKKIEHNRQMCETLEKTATTLFKSWFVDFDPVKAKMESRVPEGMEPELLNLFPDSFENSNLGPIPSGWKIKAMDEMADFLNGLALQKYPAEEGHPYLPVVKIAEINRGITQQTSKASTDIPKKYVIDNGDVLFSWSGSLTAVLWPCGKGALNQHLFKVTSSKYPKWFYYRWIWQHLTFYRMIAASKATTMGHIKRQHLSETKAFVPNSSLLKEADKIFAPMLSRIMELGIEIRCLSNMRDNLLPKLISGELRVGDVGGV